MDQEPDRRDLSERLLHAFAAHEQRLCALESRVTDMDAEIGASIGRLDAVLLKILETLRQELIKRARGPVN